MRLLSIFVIAMLSVTVPMHVFALPAGEGESVEEPDEMEGPDDMEQPKNELPPPPLEKVPAKEKPPTKSKAKNANGDTEFNTATLQVLNKVTARTQTIDAAIGSVVRSGTIEIIVHSCWKSAPEERPENAALLEISEIKHGEPPAQIFLGWMFSSSPGLSSLEDPFYDVTVIKCNKGG